MTDISILELYLMKRTIELQTAIIGFGLLCSSVVPGQDKYPGSLPEADLSQVGQSYAVPGHDTEYDPVVGEIIDRTNLDSLIAYVRILSGEDSVWINGSKVRIENRKSDPGNNLAADYIKNKLDSYELEVYDQSYSEEGRNIYAVQPGILHPEEEYIICAHYDAVDDYCADDNASGVAAVLEAARLLSQYNINYTLIYAFWDQEEIGTVGSRYYASQAMNDQAEIRGVLNLDMLGWDSNDDGLVDIHSDDVADSDSLANLLLINNSLYEINLNPVIYNPGTGASDHSSFWLNEYGAILLIEAYYGEDMNPYYHSNEDRIDKFNLPYFHNLSKLAVGSIASMVQCIMDTIPSPPVISVTPDTFNITMKPGTSEVYYITIQNIGGNILNFNILTQAPDSASAGTGWLSLELDSGSCETQSSIDIELFVDAGGLNEGEYSCQIIISSDDPFDPVIQIPVILSVSYAAGTEETADRVGISLYPNPATDFLNIESHYSGQHSVDIFSINGRLLFRQEMEGTAGRIDLSSFQKGVYFITIRSKDFVTTQKIVRL